MQCEKEWYRDHQFKAETLPKLNKVLEVIDEQEKKQEPVTLRQLNYLLTEFGFSNNEAGYGQLSRILVHARMAGLVGWNMIEDHTRNVKTPTVFDDVRDILRVAVDSFRLDLQKDQKVYLEVMVEKDTLSAIFYPETRYYGVPLNVNKGNDSVTTLRKTAQRLIDAYNLGKELKILYFGDFDPSGMAMVERTRRDLRTFNVPNCEVKFCGITREQAKEYGLRPLPVKTGDKKAPKFIQKYGHECFEIDVLGSSVLRKMVEDEIRASIDLKKFCAVREEEDMLKARVKSFVDTYDEDRYDDDNDEDDDYDSYVNNEDV